MFIQKVAEDLYTKKKSSSNLPGKKYLEKEWNEGGEKSIDQLVMDTFEGIQTNTFVVVLDPILRAIFCGMSPFNCVRKYKI